MINTLTSLRFFFAFFVFLSHLSFIDTDHKLYNWLTRNIFFEGYLGVSFFFILSGFVLIYSSAKYIKQDSFVLNKYNFYLARIFRIYPLHLLTLLISVLLFSNFELFNLRQFIPNLFLVQSFIPDIKYYFTFNTPSWSISNEMFFYLVFPFLISFFLKRKKILVSCFFIFTIILIFIQPLINGEIEKFMYYINPFVRLLDFMIGIFIYFVYRRYNNSIDQKKGTILEIICIIMFLVFFIPHNIIDRAFRYSIYYWIPMSAIVLVFAFQKGIISNLLSNKVLVYLGEVSFAFYMIHLIVINIYRSFDFSDHIILTPSILLIISLLFSIIIFEYFEKPINKRLKEKYIK